MRGPISPGRPLPGMPEPPASVSRGSSKRAVVSNSELLPTESDIRRFNSKVVQSPRCWFWTGAISTPDGYGRFTFQNRDEQRTMLAHRFALLASGVSIGSSDVAEHACNEPLCVRVSPKHVHRSTQSANLRHAVKRGRHIGNRPSVQSRRRAERSFRVRAALENGWDEQSYRLAVQPAIADQLELFPIADKSHLD